ncbi:MAG: hypothetical protein HYR90_00590 [Candidatus Andersenbacteria bacterium]|nr:hypothetical protein [Candidatus Andersenbacteria bacterium]MBI3251252.1 hypothetical protein [Candidatus Andersenbacteria bacterium]
MTGSHLNEQELAMLEGVSLKTKFGLTIQPVRKFDSICIFRLDGTAGLQEDLRKLNEFGDQLDREPYIAFGVIYWDTDRGQLIAETLNRADKKADMLKTVRPRRDIQAQAWTEVGNIVSLCGGIHGAIRPMVASSISCLLAERWFSKHSARRNVRGPVDVLYSAFHAASETTGLARRYIPLCILEVSRKTTLFVLQLPDGEW